MYKTVSGCGCWWGNKLYDSGFFCILKRIRIELRCLHVTGLIDPDLNGECTRPSLVAGSGGG
jgi:hypothetical protein